MGEADRLVVLQRGRSNALRVIFGDRPRWWGISRGSISGADRIWVWNYAGASAMAIGVDDTPNEWMHLALVHGGGMLSAYKDGSLVGSVPSGATLQPNSGGLPVLHLGGLINNASRNWTFQGETDEVQIWNVARTESEITQDMSRILVTHRPRISTARTASRLS